MTQSLEELWQEISRAGPGSAFRRVDERHPLDLYLGVDRQGSRVLLLVTDVEPPSRSIQAKGFEVDCGKRADGRWALSVCLRMPEQSKLFAHLCEDLVDASRSGVSLTGAAHFVLDRIARWERMLARANRGGLDEQEFRGLVAELAVLNTLLIPAFGGSAAVTSWIGPLGADQDFRLLDRLIEVKSTAAGSMMVTISSAEQLDVHDFPLYLVAVSIAAGDGLPGAGGTLRDLVAHIRASIVSDSTATEIFQDRLSITGYDDTSEVATRKINIGPSHFYRVSSAFPSIRRSSMHAALRSVRYELDLSLCKEFEVHSILE